METELAEPLAVTVAGPVSAPSLGRILPHEALLYVNGVLWGRAASSANAPLYGIGCFAYLPGELPMPSEFQQSVGAVGDVQVFDKCLQARQVNQLFQRSRAPVSVEPLTEKEAVLTKQRLSRRTHRKRKSRTTLVPSNKGAR